MVYGWKGGLLLAFLWIWKGRWVMFWVALPRRTRCRFGPESSPEGLTLPLRPRDSGLPESAWLPSSLPLLPPDTAEPPPLPVNLQVRIVVRSYPPPAEHTRTQNKVFLHVPPGLLHGNDFCLRSIMMKALTYSQFSAVRCNGMRGK